MLISHKDEALSVGLNSEVCLTEMIIQQFMPNEGIATPKAETS